MKLFPLWGLAVAALVAFVLWFFRDPARTVPDQEGVVVSPADGIVTAVESLFGQEFATRISIRLSLLDVHVTRAPVSGRITAIEYRRGSFRSAYDESSSAQNEQNRVRIETAHDPVLLVQIAGKVARRIVFTPVLGAWVERGERVGMIRFGSRVDLFLSAGPEVLVAVGDRVHGGASIVARGDT